MVAVFAVIHELKPRIVFEPQVVQLGIFMRCRPAFWMDVNAVGIPLPNPERVVCGMTDFDCRVALLTNMGLAYRLDVLRTEIAHHFRPENARCASTADTMNAVVQRCRWASLATISFTGSAQSSSTVIPP